MTNVGEQLAGIAGLVVGVATISVILSRKSNTPAVVQSIASGFGNVLSVATGPITGNSGTPNLNYPSSSGFDGLGQLNINGMA